VLTPTTCRYKEWIDASGTEREENFNEIELVEDVEKDLEACYAEFDQFVS